MSNPGEREAAHEIDTEVEDGEVEIEQGADESGSDEDGADGLGEEPGEGDDDNLQQDDAGGNVRQTGQPAGEAVGTKPRSAATIAVQEAKRRAKELERERDQLKAERDAELRERQGRQTAQDQEAERQRLLLMAPEEKFEYLLNKQAEQTRTQVGALQFQMQDASDRSGFEGMCARNPAFDAVRDEVERTLTDMRRNGGNSTRETVATYLIGKRAIERASKGGKVRQSSAGQKRVQSERVAAPAGRSDIQGGQRRTGGEVEGRRKRLENMDI